MGFYIRKAIKVGAIRFNLSKSGIGVSVGVKGLRLGYGPKGNYIHMGRYGLYYRKMFSNKKVKKSYKVSYVYPNQPIRNEADNLKKIESVDINKLRDCTSAELLDEIKQKRRKLSFFPLATIILMFIFIYSLFSKYPYWSLYLIGILGALLLGIIRYNDIMKKTVVILYNIEEPFRTKYERLHRAFESVAQSSRTWHIEASGDVDDPKYHGGATGIVKRERNYFSTGKIPFIKLNIDVPKISVGKKLLAFLPERVLIFEGKMVGAVSYKNLKIQVYNQQFIEDGVVPRDAKIIGNTWKYVNKNGGPDKRFRNNKTIPIVLYENIHFKSDSGLNELVLISTVGYGKRFNEAILNLASEQQKMEIRISNSHLRIINIKNSIELIKSGKYLEAIQLLDELIKQSRTDAQLYYNRGLAFYKNGERIKAITDFKQAAKLGFPKAKVILQSNSIVWK